MYACDVMSSFAFCAADTLKASRRFGSDSGIRPNCGVLVFDCITALLDGDKTLSIHAAAGWMTTTQNTT